MKNSINSSKQIKCLNCDIQLVNAEIYYLNSVLVNDQMERLEVININDGGANKLRFNL